VIKEGRYIFIKKYRFLNSLKTFPFRFRLVWIKPKTKTKRFEPYICTGWAIHSISTTYSERVHQGYQARLQSVLRNSVVLNGRPFVSPSVQALVYRFDNKTAQTTRSSLRSAVSLGAIHCGRGLLIQLQLVVFDTQSGAIRVAGVPSFLPDPACLSQQHSHLVAVTATPRARYSVSNPMALAGFETAGSPQSTSTGLI
jgi:hypothetical protein